MKMDGPPPGDSETNSFKTLLASLLSCKTTPSEASKLQRVLRVLQVHLGFFKPIQILLASGAPHLVFHYAKDHLSTFIKNYNILNLVKWIPPLIELEVGRALSLLRKEPESAIARLNALV